MFRRQENKSQDLLESLHKEKAAEVNTIMSRKMREQRQDVKPQYESYIIAKMNNSICKALLDKGLNAPVGALNLRQSQPGIGFDYSIHSGEVIKLNEGVDNKKIQRAIESINGQEISGFGVIVVDRGFINISLDSKVFGDNVVNQVLSNKAKYGQSDVMEDVKSVVDYSSPNIAKTMSVGHLRSTILGEVNARLQEEAGALVYRVNHLGDWGTQFGKLIVMYERNQNRQLEKDLEREPIPTLTKLYQGFKDAVEKDPSLDDLAREKFVNLEKGEASVIKLWNRFKKLSIVEFQEMYKRMGVKFDIDMGESFYEPFLDDVVSDVLNEGAAYEDNEGAVVVPLKYDAVNKKYQVYYDAVKRPELREHQDHGFLIRKSDGSTLYQTRDLAALKYRTGKLHVNKMQYFVAAEQSQHFELCFLVAEKIGYIKPGDDVEHKKFGFILAGGKKMSTRTGNVETLEGLFNMCKEGVHKKTQGSLSSIDEDLIGISGVVFNDLKQDSIKNIEFDINKMTDLNQASGPYLLYSVRRARTMLNKLSYDSTNNSLPSEYTQSEQVLLKHIAEVPHKKTVAAIKGEPHTLAQHILEMAQIFNSYYPNIGYVGVQEEVYHPNEHGFSKDDFVSLKDVKDVSKRQAKLNIVKAFEIAMSNSLHTLAIRIPDKM